MCVSEILVRLAEKYETSDFLISDPSRFMHEVNGTLNQEAMAFVASTLSYGSRKQFMPKIQKILDWTGGEVDYWVRNSCFEDFIPADKNCFYRLYSNQMMRDFLNCYRSLLLEWGSMGEFVKHNACTGYDAIVSITRFFYEAGSRGVIPKNAISPCKRISMFLRWMVRDGSPVDLGLWKAFIPKHSLIIPMDTHVVQEAYNFGFLPKKTNVTMKTAIFLTQKMTEIFPGDPLKADFALFGLGVEK